MDKIINLVHKEVGIVTSKHYPVTGKDLRKAIERALAGEPAPEEQRPSLGCNIKWKKGNEPEYFES